MANPGGWPDELIPINAHPIPGDRYDAASWARRLLTRGDWVVVDTETTGVSGIDQVVQVSVLDPAGRVLVDTLVQPTCEIHPKATEVHGFDRQRLASAPTYEAVHELVSTNVAGRLVIAYNSSFDERLLTQSAAVWNLPPAAGTWECAMVRYAQYVGAQRWPGSQYTWQKLPRGKAIDALHGARDDCLLTLNLIARMARHYE